MPAKQKFNRLAAQSLELGGVVIPKLVAGRVMVTGAGRVAIPGLASITSVTATPGSGGSVSATAEGNTITLSVWTADGKPSAVPTVVNYLCTGN